MGGHTQTQDGGAEQVAFLGLALVEAADLEKDPRRAGHKGPGCSRCSRAPLPTAQMAVSSADSFAFSTPWYRTSGKLHPPTGDSGGGQGIGDTWPLLIPDHLPPVPVLLVAHQSQPRLPHQPAACQMQRERLASHSLAAGRWLPQGLLGLPSAGLAKPLGDLLLATAGHLLPDGSGSIVAGRLPASIKKTFS